MREFDTLRAVIPPLVIVPGSDTGFFDAAGQPLKVGHDAVGTDYNVIRDGWNVQIIDPGKFTPTSTFTSGTYYSLYGSHRTKIEWTPWARSDISLVPLGQDVAEGKNFSGFYTAWPGETIQVDPGPPAVNASLPGWAGIDCKVLDIWTSEYVEENMLENLAWNGDLPGAEGHFPVDSFTGGYYPKNNPNTITHKLRFDQVISARYRQMVSSTNAPTSQYFGGELMTIHDQVVGGNASMSDTIYHARFVYMINSNDGNDNIDEPKVGESNFYNSTKLGFFIPSAIDTLTIGLNKIENDAEWATLARRGASR